MSFSAADALDLLSRAHAQDRLAHAYLLTGPEGCGKRKLLSDLAAKILGCPESPLSHPDVHILEPESKSRRIRIDAVREMENQLQMRSLRGGKKLGIIFDADRLQEQAANAFLKTLEEPPAQSHLFLVSAFPDQLLETILSRCIELPLRADGRIPLTESQARLLDLLADFAAIPAPALPRILLMVRQFEDLLAQVKEAIQEENEAAFKKDEALYKQFGTKKAVEDREEYFKALTESRYLGQRAGLIGVLEQWWADVIRQKAVSESQTDVAPVDLEFPSHSAHTAALAARYSMAELLAKSTAAEQLRSSLQRNIQEQLALEVTFLRLFEGPKSAGSASAAA